MTSHHLRRALRTACVLGALPALAPAAATASTWTVDDDKAQCPNAGFASVQAAVDQAAPNDTVIVCDGLYEEVGTLPPSSANSPVQAGATVALAISKPLKLKGTGAGKVTIRPAPSLGASLAGSAPYLRDGGGNVISVIRQSLGASDADENFVEISGITVDSPNAYAEAGIAFFNTSGRVANAKVGPLLRATDAAQLAARPHGYGIVSTNSLQGAGPGTVRREVSVVDSLVTGYQSGGIRFDLGRGVDGAAANDQRSGIISYGNVTRTRVEGSGPSATIPQTGVEYHAGVRGAVTASEIRGNEFTAGPRQSVGLLLTDAETGADPANPAVRGFSVRGTAFADNGYALFNADITDTAVRAGAPALATGPAATDENFFGCPAGPTLGAPSDPAAGGCEGISGNDAAATPAPSVELGASPRAAAPAPLAVPAATPDGVPDGAFVNELVIEPGGSVTPTVAAADDFGIRSVAVTASGTPLGTKATRPYEFNLPFTPKAADIGRQIVLVATITDSSAQVTTLTATLTVVAPEGYVALSANPTSVDVGAVETGRSTGRVVTLTNTGGARVDLSALGVTGEGFSLAPPGAGGCTTTTKLQPGDACAVTLAFSPAAAGAATGALSVGYAAPGGTGPLVVALAGTGTAPGSGTGGGTSPGSGPAPGPAPGAAAAPSNRALPAVVGSAEVGARLTCVAGSWSNEPEGFRYQWLRNGSVIPGATGQTYVVRLADTGSPLTCRVVAFNPAGSGAPASAPALDRVVYLSTVRSNGTTRLQVGSAILTVPSRVTLSRTGTLRLGTATCIRDGARSCVVRVSGTLRAGTRSFRVTLTRTVKEGATATLTLRLTRSARAALRSARRGTLSGSLTTTDATGRRGTATARIAVSR